MKFGKELIPKVLSGEKTVTRRPLWASWFYKEGQKFSVKDEDGKIYCWCRIKSIREEKLEDIINYGESEIDREGFPTILAFFTYWNKLYGKVDWDLLVRRIEFERC